MARISKRGRRKGMEQRNQGAGEETGKGEGGAGGVRADRGIRAAVGRRAEAKGACPPLGSGWGEVAESGRADSLYSKPQLPLFIPWCAGASRHERLL